MALQSKLFKGDSKLEAAAVSDPAHIVPGARGPHVAKIQQALIQLDGAGIAQDSAYGPATAAAVAAFKQKRQILNVQGKIDNIVGKKTIAALDAEMFATEKGGTVVGGGGGAAGGGSALGFAGGIDPALTKTIHTLIYLSGASKNTALGGVPLEGGLKEDVQIEMDNIRVEKSDEDKIVKGFGGSNITQVGVGLAFLVAMARDPRGKLIIYGFSAGGVNALQLCRLLEPVGMPVDLLITVDVSDGTRESLGVNPQVPSNVAVNRNYFQKTLLTTSIHGLKTTGPKVIPIDCTNRKFEKLTKKTNHGQMESITHLETIRDMRILINGK